MDKLRILNSSIDIFANSTPANIDENGDLVAVIDETRVMLIKRAAFDKLKNPKNTVDLACRLDEAKKVIRGLEPAHRKSISRQLDEAYEYLRTRI